MLRTRIMWVVAATTSAVILAFVIPLALLVRTLAEDRAVATARQQAQSAAIVLASVNDDQRVISALSQVDAESAAVTRIRLPSGRIIGSSGGSEPDALLEQSRADASAFTTRTDDGADVLIPVALETGTAVVHTHISFDVLRGGVATAWATIIGLGVLLLALALLAANNLARRISTPVAHVAQVAHRLRAGELTARATADGPTEVAELGQALNLLAERIDELLRTEREAAADLAHRLRSPVTALRLDAELVADPDLGSRLREHIEGLQRTVDTIVADARRPVREAWHGSCEVVEVVTQRVRFWTALAEDQNRQVDLVVEVEPTRVGLAAADLRDLLDNLIDNVFAHTAEGVPFTISISSDPGRSGPPVPPEPARSGRASGAESRPGSRPTQPGIEARGSGQLVVVAVDDGGAGVGDLGAPHRGVSGSGSSGLGLDIVRRLAHSAGGQAVLRQGRLGGLRVEVTLPALPSAA